MNATPTVTERTARTGSVRKTYPVLEMTCAACAVSVESMLKHTPGVADAGVNYAKLSPIRIYSVFLTRTTGLETI